MAGRLKSATLSSISSISLTGTDGRSTRALQVKRRWLLSTQCDRIYAGMCAKRSLDEIAAEINGLPVASYRTITAGDIGSTIRSFQEISLFLRAHGMKDAAVIAELTELYRGPLSPERRKLNITSLL